MRPGKKVVGPSEKKRREAKQTPKRIRPSTTDADTARAEDNLQDLGWSIKLLEAKNSSKLIPDDIQEFAKSLKDDLFEDPSKPVKQSHGPVPTRRTAAAIEARIGEPDHEADHNDQEIIQLGNKPITHLERFKLAPKVWNKRGKMRKEYFHLLDRNRKEGFWVESKVKVMVDMDPAQWYRIRDAPDIYNASGKIRQRGVRQVEDTRNKEGKFKKALATDEGKKINKSTIDKLLYNRLLEIDDTKTNVRVQEARAKANELAKKNIELGAKTRTYGADIASQFRDEQRELIATIRLAKHKLNQIMEENDYLRVGVEEFERASEENTKLKTKLRMLRRRKKIYKRLYSKAQANTLSPKPSVESSDSDSGSDSDVTNLSPMSAVFQRETSQAEASNAATKAPTAVMIPPVEIGDIRNNALDTPPQEHDPSRESVEHGAGSPGVAGDVSEGPPPPGS